MKLTYPVILYPFEDGQGYTIEVPDLKGCVSEGDTLAQAILMGIDAASGWVLDELESGNPAPASTKLEDTKPQKGGLVSVILLDMDAYSEKYGDQAVRKSLTIPAWLNTFAEKNHIDFSRVLQDSLTEIYESKNA